MSSINLFVILKAVLLVVQITHITAEDSQLQGRLLTPEQGCGTSNVANPKIVGGTEAKPGQYPWMAFVYYKAYFGGIICGGSLISSRHVLTAAHCIFPSKHLYVKLGAHDIRSETEAHQDIKAIRVVKHPNFNGSHHYANDIAVITLEKDVEFTDRIRPICLPLSEDLQNRSFVGLSPFVAGWGRLEEHGDLSDVLMHVQMQVIDNNRCKSFYKFHDQLDSEDELGEHAVCAGHLEGGKDTWRGDSGGPLMLPIEENGGFAMYQIGIVSYGIGCAQEYSPGVYSKVQHFMNWIQETVNQK